MGIDTQGVWESIMDIVVKTLIRCANVECVVSNTMIRHVDV